MVASLAVAACAMLLLAGCSEMSGSALTDYPGEPHGVVAPRRSAGGAQWATWMKKATRFAVTLYGSSSCPPAATGYRITGSNEITLTMAKPKDGAKACTADYAPHTTVFATPSAVRIGTDVTIVVPAPASGGKPTTVPLPAYTGTTG